MDSAAVILRSQTTVFAIVEIIMNPGVSVNCFECDTKLITNNILLYNSFDCRSGTS